MRKTTIAVSFGTALIVMCSTVSAYALNGTPIYKPTGPPTVDPHPPFSSGGDGSSTGGTGSTSGGSGTTSGTVTVRPGPKNGDTNGGNYGGGGGSAVVDKLQGKPLDVCKVRQNGINDILARVVKRSTNQSAFFGEIATKVENYVTTNNLTVPNYSTLTGNITSDKAKVQSDITALKANDVFNCGGTNPTSTASAIKTEVKQTITDLQTYRSDDKALIVAVKAVVQASSTTTGGTKS